MRFSLTREETGSRPYDPGVNALVFEFLKRRPVKFLRDEEVEISLPSSASHTDIFITRVSQHVSQKLYLQIPPQVIRRSTLEPDMEITIRLTRNNLLGTSKARIIEILHDENPPLFVVQLISDILWEEIVPSRLAEPSVEEKPPCLKLVIGDGEKEYAGNAQELNSAGLLFTSSVPFEPLLRLTVGVLLDEHVTFNAEVLSCLRKGDDSMYEVIISLSEMDDINHNRLAEALARN